MRRLLLEVAPAVAPGYWIFAGTTGNGGNGQDRGIIEGKSNLSNRPLSFARFLSCVRSRALWGEAARADQTSTPRHIGVYDTLRLTAKAIEIRDGIDWPGKNHP